MCMHRSWPVCYTSSADMLPGRSQSGQANVRFNRYSRDPCSMAATTDAQRQAEQIRAHHEWQVRLFRCGPRTPGNHAQTRHRLQIRGNLEILSRSSTRLNMCLLFSIIFQIVAITSEGKCKSKMAKVRTQKDECKSSSHF